MRYIWKTVFIATNGRRRFAGKEREQIFREILNRIIIAYRDGIRSIVRRGRRIGNETAAS
jgi:hypothetical protein